MSFLLDNIVGSGAYESHTTDSGHTIGNAPNVGGSDPTALVISSTKVYATAGLKYGAVVFNVAPPSPDYEFSVPLFLLGTHSAEADVGIRWLEGTPGGYATGYYAQVIRSDATHLNILVYEVPSGSQLNGSGAVIYTVTAAGAFVFTIRAVGTALTIMLDGASIWTGTNSVATAAGKPYLALYPNPSFSTDAAFGAGLEATNLGVGLTAFWTGFAQTSEVDS